MNRRITIVSSSFWPEIGGPSSYVQIIAPALVKAGFSVQIVTRSGKSRYPGDDRFGCQIHRVKRRAIAPWSHAAYLLRLFRVALKSDILFAQGPVSSGFPAALVKMALGKKLIIRVPGDHAWERYALKNWAVTITEFQKISKIPLKIRILKKIQMFSVQRADAIVVSSKFLAGIVAGWGVDKKKIHVLYNCVSVSISSLSKEEARKKVGIYGHLVVSVGRLVPWKGFRMLVKIMPKLLEINQSLRLVIVGDGPEQYYLLKMIANLGLSAKVFLVGRKSQAELGEYLAAADIFMLNSSYESWPFQIIEAMAAGVPVISTNSGGIPEGIIQGENGFMVKYNDEFNLVQAFQTLWRDEELREHFIESGRKTASEFTSQRVAKETIALLSHV